MPSADEAKIVRGKDGKLRLENFYTPLAEAKKEIQRRRKDKKLKKKIEDFLEGDIPDIFKKKPKAVFARHVATPNYEHIHFLKKTAAAELDPLFLEYLSDKFDTNNICKYFLGKTVCALGRGKRGGEKSSCDRIINFKDSENKKLKQVKTYWDENLIEFHHRIFDVLYSGIGSKISNQSEWVIKKGKKPETFYKYFLTLFMYHGILFENYLLNSEENKFTSSIVLPAFNEIKSIFGQRPLIVRLLPQNNEADLFWYYYPELIKDEIEKSKI